MAELYSNLIDLEGKVSPATLSGIVNLNVSLLYQMRQKGYLDKEVAELTYREAIQQIVGHYKSKQEIKLQKQEQEHEIRLKRTNGRLTLTMPEGDDGVSLEAAKLRQSIKLDAAREEQIYQKIAIERGGYITHEALAGIAAPVVMTIRDMLVAISNDFPEVQTRVDKIMDELHDLGLKLIDESLEDRDNFVKEMCDRDIIE